MTATSCISYCGNSSTANVLHCDFKSAHKHNLSSKSVLDCCTCLMHRLGPCRSVTLAFGLSLFSTLSSLPFSLLPLSSLHSTIVYEFVTLSQPFSSMPSELIIWEVGKRQMPVLHHMNSRKLKDIIWSADTVFHGCEDCLQLCRIFYQEACL